MSSATPQAQALTAAAVYQLQQDRDFAYSRAAGCGDPACLTSAERAEQQQRQREYAELQQRMTAAHAALNGRVYRVPDENLDGLTKRVNKINRRADKLNVPPVQYQQTTETWERVRTSDTTGEVTQVIPHTFVIVGAQAVKLAGWQFVATIEHDEEEGNIIRQVPRRDDAGLDLREYRTAAPWCHHCKTVRNRIDTFIVAHEDGATKQVGRNCLVDFLGATANAAARYAEYLIELQEALDDAEEWGASSGATGDRAVPLDEYLTHVAVMIRTSRWTSRSAAYEYGGYATADAAASNLRDCRKADYQPARSRDEHHVIPEQQDRDAAAAAIKFARDTWGAKPIQDRDDFEHNIAVATAKDYLPTRRMGIAAYTVQAHRKAIEQDVRERKAAAQQFVGEPGQRLTVKVTVARIVELADRYSYNRDATKPLYLFVDEDGNDLKWFASNWEALKAGESYTIKGTVKRHEDDPQYGKATILTRCKVQA